MREGKKIYRQEKSSCGAFLTDISKTHELIAPVKDEVVRFESVTSVDKITLESPCFFPVKDFFFLKEEIIFTFEGNDIKVPELKPIKRVFFGLRRCDLNGIKRQDTALLGNIKEPYYQLRRKQSTLIGFHCEKAPLEYCFCESLEKEEFFDLMYYDRGDHYLIEIGSDAGRELIEKHFDHFNESQVEITPEEKIIEGADRLIKKDISALYEQKTGRRVLNYVCHVLLVPPYVLHVFVLKYTMKLRCLIQIQDRANVIGVHVNCKVSHVWRVILFFAVTEKRDLSTGFTISFNISRNALMSTCVSAVEDVSKVVQHGLIL